MAPPGTLTLSLSLREREPFTERLAMEGPLSLRERDRVRVTRTWTQPNA
jgi:hypothetical protein